MGLISENEAKNGSKADEVNHYRNITNLCTQKRPLAVRQAGVYI